MLLTIKGLILISIFTSFVFSCTSKQADTTQKKQLTVSAEVDSLEIGENLVFIHLTVKLENPTPDTMKYITMSCSWQDPFVADMKGLSVVNAQVCDKNVPQLKEILPSTSEEVKLHLTSTKLIAELKDKRFRVGFNWVSVRDHDEMFLKLPELKELKNVMWSNTLKIQKLSNES